MSNIDEAQLRGVITKIARMMATAGLAEAFGHVSMRWQAGFAITHTMPFVSASPADVIVVEHVAQLPKRVEGRPLETVMHAAIYAARPDVLGICRGHPASVVSWGTGTEPLPLLHGLGALAGGVVRVNPEIDLISTPEQADALAGTLGAGSSVILRANGGLAVGASLLEALTRLYFLEERARVALASDIPPDELDWSPRLEHTEIELRRAMAWVDATFGEGQ